MAVTRSEAATTTRSSLAAQQIRYDSRRTRPRPEYSCRMQVQMATTARSARYSVMSVALQTAQVLGSRQSSMLLPSPSSASRCPSRQVPQDSIPYHIARAATTPAQCRLINRGVANATACFALHSITPKSRQQARSPFTPRRAVPNICITFFLHVPPQHLHLVLITNPPGTSSGCRRITHRTGTGPKMRSRQPVQVCSSAGLSSYFGIAGPGNGTGGDPLLQPPVP